MFLRVHNQIFAKHLRNVEINKRVIRENFLLTHKDDENTILTHVIQEKICYCGTYFQSKITKFLQDG